MQDSRVLSTTAGLLHLKITRHPTRFASLGTLPIEGRESANAADLLPLDGGGGPEPVEGPEGV